MEKVKMQSGDLMQLPVLFALLLAFTGCSIIETRPAEDVVASRAQNRVDALMAGDYEAAYAFTTPGYRTAESAARYGTRWSGVGMWRAAEVSKVNCNEAGNKCMVAIRVTFYARQFGEQTTSLREEWLLIGGNWYVYQDIGAV
jgi:hypothetical protein